jgi:hypothetical protein
VPALNLPARPQTASGGARSSSAREINSSLAAMAEDYPKMWASLTERAAEAGPQKEQKQTRLEFLEGRMLDEREAKQKSE